MKIYHFVLTKWVSAILLYWCLESWYRVGCILYAGVVFLLDINTKIENSYVSRIFIIIKFIFLTHIFFISLYKIWKYANFLVLEF